MSLSSRLPSVVQPPTIAFNPPGGPTPEGLAGLVCPNCGSLAAKALVLTVDVQLPDNPGKRLRVLRCPDCTANFYDSQVPPDYAEPALNNRGRVPFYVQQGAGVSLITRPLAQLRAAPGSAYMEVGCGYGFGLDFALNTRGWRGVGIDPAPLAALGRDALGLPIELRYLRDDDEAVGTIDVVLGSEVIEHVTSPAAFVRTLRAMLRPGGTLVLTTPNGDDIDPGTPPGIIVPLLSPSLHLVIQNRVSLRTLLVQAGFGHVEVDVDSHSLVAFASDAPLELERDHGALRRIYREHLEHRARTTDAGTDLFIGFAGRAYQECVNDGELAAADRVWALLVPACRNRFGLEIDGLAVLPAALARCSLEEMAGLVPLNLGGLLYANGVRRLAGGTPRAVLLRQFGLAAEACAAMRRALGELAMEDGQTEDIGWTAEAEALLCATDAGSADLAAAFGRLPPAPNGGEPRRLSIILRALTDLVNAGRYAEGRAFVAAMALSALPFVQEDVPLEGPEAGALFCLAMLDAEIGADGAAVGDPAAARQRFARVRRAAQPGDGLWWSALRGGAQALRLLGRTDALAGLAEEAVAAHPAPEVAAWSVPILVNAGAYESARALASQFDLLNQLTPRLARSPVSAADQDLLFGLAMLETQSGADGRAVGDPSRARQLFGLFRRGAAPRTGGWWAALRGEVQSLGLLGQSGAVADIAESIAHDVTDAETARWAFPSLVNAGRYAAARALASRAGLDTATFTQPGIDRALSDAERDIVFCLAVLDVQPGPEGGRPEGAPGGPATARGRFLRVRMATAPGADLWWAALRGELHALDALEAHDDARALVVQVGSAHPGLAMPDDVAARLVAGAG